MMTSRKKNSKKCRKNWKKRKKLLKFIKLMKVRIIPLMNGKSMNKRLMMNIENRKKEKVKVFGDNN